MSKLEKIKLLMDFWFSPWGAGKGAFWEGFSNDRPFNEFYATQVIMDVLDNASNQDWDSLKKFMDPTL